MRHPIKSSKVVLLSLMSSQLLGTAISPPAIVGASNPEAMVFDPEMDSLDVTLEVTGSSAGFRARWPRTGHALDDRRGHRNWREAHRHLGLHHLCGILGPGILLLHRQRGKLHRIYLVLESLRTSHCHAVIPVVRVRLEHRIRHQRSHAIEVGRN